MYEGEWHLNERHGKGTMHWYDRGERYTGQWVKSIQHGRGEHMWIIQGSDNAQVDLLMMDRQGGEGHVFTYVCICVQYPLCNRYDGGWNQGKREGFGTFYYAK